LSLDGNLDAAPAPFPSFGSVTRNSPLTSVALTREPSKAPATRTARAKRPEPRSTR
jgi:hypothetical protein